MIFFFFLFSHRLWIFYHRWIFNRSLWGPILNHRRKRRIAWEGTKDREGRFRSIRLSVHPVVRGMPDVTFQCHGRRFRRLSSSFSLVVQGTDRSNHICCVGSCRLTPSIIIQHWRVTQAINHNERILIFGCGRSWPLQTCFFHKFFSLIGTSLLWDRDEL